jgi:hypothetical protein
LNEQGLPLYPADEELADRLENREDSFVERKSSMSDRAEIRKAVCAFANTVRAPMYGVLFIGVDDKGNPTGTLDEESHSEAAKKVGQYLEQLCPPVPHFERWLAIDNHRVLAVVVPESPNSPHFTGPAYVRKGAESPKACYEMLDQLIADRLSVARELRQWFGKTISLAEVRQNNPMHNVVQRRKEVVVTEVTPHWIAWRRTSNDSHHSIPLEQVQLQKDPGTGGLLILIPTVEWVE